MSTSADNRHKAAYASTKVHALLDLRALQPYFLGFPCRSIRNRSILDVAAAFSSALYMSALSSGDGH